MTESASHRRMKWGGFVLGVVVAVAMLVAWRVPGGNRIAGLDLTINVNPTGELQITPAGPVFHANGLTPGAASGPAGGSFVVRNRTGSTLAIRLRALPSTFGMDDALHVEVRAGKDDLLAVSLGALRSWSPNSFMLASGASAIIAVRVWLVADAAAYRGGEVMVTLEFQSVPEPD